MPSGPNFAATVLPHVAIAESAIFKNPSLYKKYMRKAKSLSAVTDNQTATFTPVMLDANKQCRKFRVGYLVSDGSTTAATSLGCTIGAGSELNSDYKEMFAERYFGDKFTIKAQSCENVFTEADAVAKAFMISKSKIRAKMNKELILFLNGNASTINDYSGGTSSAGVKTYPSATWENVDQIMFEMIQEAEFNDLDNVTLLNGTNLNKQSWTAMYKGTNGCCVDDKAILDDFGRIAWDTRFLEPELANEKVSFLIDANRVAVLNDWDQTLSGKPKETSHNTIAFLIEDDMVQISDGKGGFSNLVLEVYREEMCTIVNNAQRKNYNYQVAARWDFVLAPSLDANKTGIIKLVNA